MVRNALDSLCLKEQLNDEEGTCGNLEDVSSLENEDIFAQGSFF